MNPDKVLNDRIAFGKFDNTTLRFKSSLSYSKKNISQFYNYYLTSNIGPCSSQVENYYLSFSSSFDKKYFIQKDIFCLNSLGLPFNYI